MSSFDPVFFNQLYSHFFNDARDIILIFNQDYQIIEANPAAEAIYGYSKDEMLALTVQDLRTSEANALISSQLALARGSGTIYETIHRRKDGEVFPAEFSSKEFDVNGQTMICSIGRDISDRKSIEQALLTSYDELQAAYRQIETQTRKLRDSQIILQLQNNELKNIQKQLNEREEMYRVFLNSIDEMFNLKDHEFRYVLFNDKFQDFLDLDEKELTGIDDYAIYPEKVADEMLQKNLEAMQADGVITSEEAKDGRVYEVRRFKVPIQENLAGVGTVIRDVTEAKLADAKRTRLERIVSHSKSIAFACNMEPELSVEYVSENIAQFGYSPEEFLTGKTGFFDILHKDDSCKVAACMRQFVDTRQEDLALDFRIHDKAGDLFWVNEQAWIRCDEKGEACSIEGLIVDITQRKELEISERKNRSRLECLVELAAMQSDKSEDIIAYVMNAALSMTSSELSFVGLISADDKSITILKWSERAMEKCRMDVKPLEYSIEQAGMWADAVRLMKPVIINDYMHIPDRKSFLPEGHTDIERFLAVPIFDGSRVGALVVVGNKQEPYEQEDVDQLSLLLTNMWGHVRKKFTERMILEDRERLKVSIASIGEGIIVIDMEHRIITINPAAMDLIGLSGPLPQGENIKRILPLQNRSVGAETDKVYESLLTREKVRQDNLHLISGDGGYKLISATASPVYGSDGVLIGHVLLIIDITDIKRKEAQQILAQKLESIGQLAAGIAHEINTPMQYIGDNMIFLRNSFHDIHSILNAYRDCLTQMKQDAAYTDSLQAIEALEQELELDFILQESQEALAQGSEGIEIVNRLVRALRDFSHTGSEERGWYDLNQAIESTIRVSHNQWKYWAEMESNFDESLPVIYCTISQINQVILNMIVNSAQAIEEMIKHGQYAQGKISISTFNENDIVKIVVEDNGGGIPAEARSRIFDPFYTTKDVGKGTGQGLAIAHDIIVNKHHGTIEVETEEGVGTRFVITIPLAADSAQT